MEAGSASVRVTSAGMGQAVTRVEPSPGVDSIESRWLAKYRSRSPVAQPEAAREAASMRASRIAAERRILISTTLGGVPCGLADGCENEPVDSIERDSSATPHARGLCSFGARAFGGVPKAGHSTATRFDRRTPPRFPFLVKDVERESASVPRVSRWAV
jgi:hypothetical protein